jgi:hypothetical protein
MSLHALANHLQQAGRGDDKVLIHMTPKEVKGLQSLAMAHGGSLTVNPQTGLPEAGFLSRLLPTLIGAGLTIASGGALSPLMAAGITGAGYGIAKGSLKEGLMAGLGAYGGAGLASGLNAAGAAGAANAGANAGTTAAVDAVDDVAAAKLGNATTNAATNSSYTGAKAAVDTTGNTVTNSGGLQGYQAPSPFDNAPQGINAGNYRLPNGTYAAPPSTPSTMTYTASSNPFEYTSKLAKIQNDPLMEAQLGAKATISPPSYMDNVKAGFGEATGSFKGLQNVWDKTPTGTGYGLLATGMGIMQDNQNKGTGAPAPKDSYLRPYDYSVEQDPNAYAPNDSTSERRYFKEPRFTPRPIEKIAKEGGLMGINNYAVGGPVEQISAENAIGGNMMYPQSQLQTPVYSNPMMSRPMPTDVIDVGGDAPVGTYTGEQRMASGGISTLGGYSDGGRLLKGPGDGVSDSIPASIGDRQPARLADGEFVVPARIVSEIGNGSTEAGARKLYAMMERVQNARRKTTGKNQVAKNTKAERLLPA